MNIHRTTMRAARRLLVPALALVTLGACGELTDLDETAETFISPDLFYRNDAQAAQAVNAVYAPLMGWNGWKSPAQYSLMCDDPDLLCWNWMSGGKNGEQAGQWYMQDNSVYIGDYQIIERANQVLAYVPASSGVSAEMKDLASGQALFARGYAYFDLVRRYGGVPLRLQPYQPDPQFGARARATSDSIWLQAAKDLRAAAPLLPVSYTQSNGRGLPTRSAAWGLLSKVYLHMAGAEVRGTTLEPLRAAYLDSSRLAAMEVMSDATVRLEEEYMDLFDTQKQNNSPEILWAIQGASVNNSGSQVPGYFGPRGDCTVIGGCGQGFLSLREDFYDMFAPNDERIESQKSVAMSWELTNTPLGKLRAIHEDSLAKLYAAGAVVNNTQFRWESWTEICGAFGHRYDTLTFQAPNGTQTKQVVGIARPYYTLKYIDPAHLTTDQAAANNFIIIRYADVLLTFAEADAERAGTVTPAARAAINQVRARSDIGPIPGTLTLEQFRDTVSWERRKELHAEFQSRFDLIRQGRWLTEMNRTSAAFPDHGVCKPRKVEQLLQNIPNKELAANPLLTQNPGY